MSDSGAIDLIKTNKVGYKLARNGYLYRRYRVYSDRSYSRCTKSDSKVRRCCATSSDGKIEILKSSNHDHGPVIGRAEAEKKINELKERTELHKNGQPSKFKKL